jgi:hypothetical protein
MARRHLLNGPVQEDARRVAAECCRQFVLEGSQPLLVEGRRLDAGVPWPGAASGGTVPPQLHGHAAFPACGLAHRLRMPTCTPLHADAHKSYDSTYLRLAHSWAGSSIITGGGLRVRARRPGERRSVPTECRLHAEQVEEDHQQMQRCLTGDGLRGRARVVCGDPAEATLHRGTRLPWCGEDGGVRVRRWDS